MLQLKFRHLCLNFIYRIQCPLIVVRLSQHRFTWYQSVGTDPMSKTSTTSASTSRSLASTMLGAISMSAGLLPTPSFAQFINTKLNWDNFLLWKALIVLYLGSQQLMLYVDGSAEKPSPTTTKPGSYIQVRMQLANLKKKETSVMDYFRQVKNLANTITSIGRHSS